MSRNPTRRPEPPQQQALFGESWDGKKRRFPPGPQPRLPRRRARQADPQKKQPVAAPARETPAACSRISWSEKKLCPKQKDHFPSPDAPQASGWKQEQAESFLVSNGSAGALSERNPSQIPSKNLGGLGCRGGFWGPRKLFLEVKKFRAPCQNHYLDPRRFGKTRNRAGHKNGWDSGRSWQKPSRSVSLTTLRRSAGKMTIP